MIVTEPCREHPKGLDSNAATNPQLHINVGSPSHRDVPPSHTMRGAKTQRQPPSTSFRGRRKGTWKKRLEQICPLTAVAGWLSLDNLQENLVFQLKAHRYVYIYIEDYNIYCKGFVQISPSSKSGRLSWRLFCRKSGGTLQAIRLIGVEELVTLFLQGSGLKSPKAFHLFIQKGTHTNIALLTCQRHPSSNFEGQCWSITTLQDVSLTTQTTEKGWKNMKIRIGRYLWMM